MPSASLTLKKKWMGSSETMVVSSVGVPVVPPITRLPTLSSWRLARPASGRRHPRIVEIELRLV